MAISARRRRLCKTFLDACYERYDGNDIPTKGNFVGNYQDPDYQATYSVMYFAKSVGCWRYIRELVDSQCDDASHVLSIGAGPQFCVMGWFFDHPPAPETSVWAFDYLTWGWVRRLDAHGDLLGDILVDAAFKTFPRTYFPEDMPPQCASVGGAAKPIPAQRVPEGSIVLLPMVLNHILGDIDRVSATTSLEEWFRALEDRAGKIVLVDMQSDGDTQGFWTQVGTLVGLSGRPRSVSGFRDLTREFAPCYPDTVYKFRPENTRRVGTSYKFCQVAGAVFEQGRGWRWLEDPDE
jgi:hypothetical protein